MRKRKDGVYGAEPRRQIRYFRTSSERHFARFSNTGGAMNYQSSPPAPLAFAPRTKDTQHFILWFEAPILGSKACAGRASETQPIKTSSVTISRIPWHSIRARRFSCRISRMGSRIFRLLSSANGWGTNRGSYRWKP